MTWKDLILSMSGKDGVTLMSYATTGLANPDPMFGTALINVNADGTYGSETVLFMSVSADDLARSVQYHGVTPDMLASACSDDAKFSEALATAVKGPLLTYNASFIASHMHGAVSQFADYVVDLLYFARAAATGCLIEPEEDTSFPDIVQAVKVHNPARPRLKDVCAMLGVHAEPVPGRLPMLCSLDLVRELFEKLGSLEMSRRTTFQRKLRLRRG